MGWLAAVKVLIWELFGENQAISFPWAMYDKAETRKHRELFFPANGRNPRPLGRGEYQTKKRSM